MTQLMTAFFVAGLSAVSFGCWLAWHPAGFIVGGLFLMLLPVWYVRGEQQ